MGWGYKFQVYNATQSDFVLAPSLNSDFNAQMTDPVVLGAGGTGSMYFEINQTQATFTLNIFSAMAVAGASGAYSQISPGSISVLFDAGILSTLPSGSMYVSSFVPPQLGNNTWVYPYMFLVPLGGSYNWTWGGLYLLPVLDPLPQPASLSKGKA